MKLNLGRNPLLVLCCSALVINGLFILRRTCFWGRGLIVIDSNRPSLLFHDVMLFGFVWCWKERQTSLRAVRLYLAPLTAVACGFLTAPLCTIKRLHSVKKNRVWKSHLQPQHCTSLSIKPCRSNQHFMFENEIEKMTNVVGFFFWNAPCLEMQISQCDSLQKLPLCWLHYFHNEEKKAPDGEVNLATCTLRPRWGDSGP